MKQRVLVTLSVAVAMAGCGVSHEGPPADLDGGTSDDLPCAPSDAVWSVTENGGQGEDVAYSVAVDDEGRVFVAGVMGGPEGGDVAPIDRAWMASYSEAGESRWSITNVPDVYSSVAQSIVVHTDGGAIALGNVMGPWLSWLRRLDADGDEVWTADPALGDGCIGLAMATLDDGGVVVIGRTTFPAEIPSLFPMRRFDASGRQLWAREQEGPLGDWPIRVAARDDRIVVLGLDRIEEGANQSFAVWLAAYDLDGELLWSRLDDSGDVMEIGNDLAIDASGAILVVGHRGSMSSVDAFFRKYDREGETLWTQLLDQAPDEESASAVAIEPDGGFAAGGTVQNGAWVGRFDDTGEPRWIARSGPGDAVRDVAIDPNGRIIVAGEAFVEDSPPEQSYDAWIACYCP